MAESPLEEAAEGVGETTTNTFALLGDETRLAILLALWEHFEPFGEGRWDPTEGNAVPFTALRNHIGIRDPGKFHYHIEKLEGELVEKTPAGYQLLPAGSKLVRAIIANAGFAEAALELSELDLPCRHCGGQTAVTYRNQRLYHVCTACEGSHLLGENHPTGVISAQIGNPTILHDREPEEVFETMCTVIDTGFSLRTGETCPQCSGRLDISLDVCADHDTGKGETCQSCGRQYAAMVWFACTVCKHPSQSALTYLSTYHPAVVAFGWRHGVELGFGTRDLESTSWLHHLGEIATEDVISTEPLLVRITLRYANEAVELTFNEALDVVAVNEDY